MSKSDSSDEDIYTASTEGAGAEGGNEVSSSAGKLEFIELEPLLKPFPLGYSGYPTNWKNVNESSERRAQLIDLKPDCKEYSLIKAEFERVGVKIKSLKRVQNSFLWQRFRNEAQDMCRNRPDEFDLNEEYLYHGTTVPSEQICEEGLDHRLSRIGFFGRGIYFSDNPQKCIKYSSQDQSEELTILKCRVLLGDTKVYAPYERDPNLKREPPKENGDGHWKYYDSVKGRPKDLNEFVIYENRRALVEYVLKCTGGKRPKTPSKQKQKPSTRSGGQDEKNAELEEVEMMYGQHNNHGDEKNKELEEVQRMYGGTRGGQDERNEELEEVERMYGANRRRSSSDELESDKEGEAMDQHEELAAAGTADSHAANLRRVREEVKKKRQKDQQQDNAREPADIVHLRQLADLRALFQVKNSPEEWVSLMSSYSATFGRPLVPDLQHADLIPRTATEDLYAERTDAEGEVADTAVEEVYNTLITEFLNITQTEDAAKARDLITMADMDINKAVMLFFDTD